MDARDGRRTFVPALLAGVLCCVAWLAASPEPQRAVGRSTAPPSLPPLVQTCPMHPDVVEARAGSCPICRMNLVPARLAASWMCPVHAAVVEAEGGACRLCGRSLVPVTVTLTWTCRGDVNTEHLEPGVCRDGSPRLVKRTLRPHGNHNPQHGGQFFMAADSWHHLEGVVTPARRFRLHVYDDYARPLGDAALRRIVGRVVLEERAGDGTQAAREMRAVALKAARDGPYLEARLPPLPWPVRLAAKVTLKPGEPEYRFDFTFAAASIDRAPVAPRRREPSGRTAATETASAATPAGDKGATDRAATLPAPATIPEIVDAIGAARREIAALIASGEFPAVWVPAFKAKDLALMLEPHLAHLAPGARASAESAVFRLVQAAWRLDAAGDTGNRGDVEAAFAQFGDALDAVGAAYAP